MKIEEINLSVKFNMNRLELEAACALLIDRLDSKLCFYLNKTLKILSIFVVIDNNRINLQCKESGIPGESFFTSANYWEATMSETIQNTSHFWVHFEYIGTITPDKFGTNYISSDFLELGCYAPWYPIISLDDRPKFTLKVHTFSGWSFTANADLKSVDVGWEWEQSHEDFDVTLLGIRKNMAINKQESQFFWGLKENHGIFSQLEHEINQIYSILKKWLNHPETESFTIAMTPRKRGGTYVRKNLIVTQQISKEYIEKSHKKIIRSWAHELSHLWFNKSSINSFDNWIDEALAEFLSILICKHLYGDEVFNQFISEFTDLIAKHTESLPPINMIGRSHPKAHLVYYKWGGLIFYNVYTKLGEQIFLKVLSEYVKESRITNQTLTSVFLNALEKVSEQDWGDFFEDVLAIDPKKGVVKY